MPAEKTMAIVLKTIEFSETSCIATLFTQDFGKISALAKGARRPKGPFENALDLLAIVRLVFLCKSGDTLDLLTEAKLERRFRAGARDLTRLYSGYYVAELLQELTDTHDPNPELFAVACAALEALDTDAPPATVIVWFELAALRLLGHMPQLSECAVCGTELAEGRVSFGLLDGGVLCPTCRSGRRQVISLSMGALGALRRLAEQESLSDALAEPISERGELRGLLNGYFSHLLGHRPRMYLYLHSLSG